MTVTSATSSNTAAGLMALLNASQSDPTSTSSTSAASSAEKRRENAMTAAFNAAASTLGMSADDLTTALQSGQTLTSLASSAGVSTDTLTSAISTALSGSDTTLSSDQANSIASGIVSGTPPTRHGHHDATSGSDSGRGAAFGKALDAAASELGLSTDQLRSELGSGSSLQDIASQQGVSSDDLTSTLSSALSAADSSLSSTQATQIAERLAQGSPSRQGGMSGGGMGMPPGPPPGGGTDAVGAAFTAAAKTLGISGDTLQQDLQSGDTLASLASSSGVSTDDLTSALTGALSSADPSMSSADVSSLAQQLLNGPGNDGTGSGSSPDGQQGNPFDVSGAYDWLGSLAGMFTSTVDTSG